MYYNRLVEEALRWMDAHPRVRVELVGDHIDRLREKTFIAVYRYSHDGSGFSATNETDFETKYPGKWWVPGPAVSVKGLQVLDLRNNVLLRYLYEPHEVRTVYRGDTLRFDRGSIRFTMS